MVQEMAMPSGGLDDGITGFTILIVILAFLVIVMGFGTVWAAMSFVFKNMYFVGTIVALVFVWLITSK
jgi:hypothetical protein